jgi:hypothetical protein
MRVSIEPIIGMDGEMLLPCRSASLGLGSGSNSIDPSKLNSILLMRWHHTHQNFFSHRRRPRPWLDLKAMNGVAQHRSIAW